MRQRPGIWLCLWLGLMAIASARHWYAVTFEHGSIWSMGGMGMYATLDYPPFRHATAVGVTADGQRYAVDPNQLEAAGFVPYETFLSYPSAAHAHQLAASFNAGTPQLRLCSLSLWTLQFDRATGTLSKTLLTQTSTPEGAPCGL
ncbi:MAG: hypothetical protein GC134_03240 [Proteobacteria bacterium]|nr:hypothetical protein [Pseudomonadota bacterium]